MSDSRNAVNCSRLTLAFGDERLRAEAAMRQVARNGEANGSRQHRLLEGTPQALSLWREMEKKLQNIAPLSTVGYSVDLYYLSPTASNQPVEPSRSVKCSRYA
jgi:hypothetical protein